MLLMLDYKRHWNEFEADIDIKQSTNLYFLMMWNIRDIAGGVERFTSSWFSVSSTWWQPRTVWEAAVQPAAHYYIRKLEAQKPKGHTYIKQMVTHTRTQKREKFAVRLRAGSALRFSLWVSIFGRFWLRCSHYATHNAQKPSRLSKMWKRRFALSARIYLVPTPLGTCNGHRSSPLALQKPTVTQTAFPRVCYHKDVVHCGTVTDFKHYVTHSETKHHEINLVLILSDWNRSFLQKSKKKPGQL